MILFDLHLRLPSEKSTEVLQSLWRITGRVRVQTECLDFRVFADTEDDDTIRVQQLWNSPQSMERHIGSEEFRTILAAMDLAAERPDVRFLTISKSAGFELIERVRAPA